MQKAWLRRRRQGISQNQNYLVEDLGLLLGPLPDTVDQMRNIAIFLPN